MNKYESILNYDYYMKHKRMSINERSYEFAPFSALVGFTDLIKERERETISKKILTDEEKEYRAAPSGLWWRESRMSENPHSSIPSPARLRQRQATSPV